MAQPRVRRWRVANLADKPVVRGPDQQNAEDRAERAAADLPPSRVGRKVISGYFSPEMSLAMHMCARRAGVSLQALMVEAFNDVLRKHGESPITGGQVHDARKAEALIADIPEGATLLGDKGYDSNAIREAAATRGAWANIADRSNRKQRFGFSPWLYRKRNLVERFFNRIKQFRGIATRYDKNPANVMAAVKRICTRIWCAP